MNSDEPVSLQLFPMNLYLTGLSLFHGLHDT